jgi:hypothetical protein
MALSVDYLYKFDLDLMMKNQAGGLGNEQWERFWNDAQGSYQDDLLGRYQKQNNGKTGILTGLIENETILQKISPFISQYSLTVTGGKATKPSDFIFRTSLMINGYNCYKINYAQRDSVTHNLIDPPGNNTYYFLEYQDYYEFLPNNVTSATLDYVKTPPNVKWGYTYDADGRQIYDVGASIQPLWDNNSCREISKRVMKTLGVSFKDQDYEQFGKSVEMTGE